MIDMPEEYMDHEDVYALMMEALDGELSDSGWAELESHLRARPRLAHEWEAMRAVDALFRNSPILNPAIDLTRRTVAQLPSPRQRLYAGIIIYVMLLASGLIPLGAIAWIAIQLLPVVAQPAFLRGLWQAGVEFLQLLQVMTTALLGGAGEFGRQQPDVLAWFVVIVAVIILWAAVYNRLVLQSRRIQS